MVSLATDGDRQGAYFFDDQEVGASERTDDNEELLASDVHLVRDSEPVSKPIRTEFVAVIQMILITLFLLDIFIFPYALVPVLYNDDDKRPNRRSLSIIIYSQVTMYLLLVLMERYLHFRHRESLRLGYLEFYRDTQAIKRIPCYTFSAGNAVILFGVMMTVDFNWVDIARGGESKYDAIPLIFLQIVGTVESVVAWAVSLHYARKVFKFNKRREQPDVEQEEAVAAAMHPNTHIPDVGFRDTNYVDNLLEKQADLIHYLKQHTVYLNNLIVRLKNGTAHSQPLNSIG